MKKLLHVMLSYTFNYILFGVCVCVFGGRGTTCWRVLSSPVMWVPCV